MGTIRHPYLLPQHCEDRMYINTENYNNSEVLVMEYFYCNSAISMFFYLYVS